MPRVVRVEYHAAHRASAFYASEWDAATVISIDGFGDFASVCWASVRGNTIAIGDELRFPNLLGILYQALTQYLGFRNYGDEYKLMGLAAYGDADAAPDLRPLVEFLHCGQFRLDLRFFAITSSELRTPGGMVAGKLVRCMRQPWRAGWGRVVFLMNR